MSDQAPLTSGSLPAQPGSDADRVCAAFEAAWKAGLRPAIEPYLTEAPAAARALLLRELLRLDLAYRGRANEKPTLEEYRLRFPEQSDLIQAVFADTPTAPGTPQPKPLPPAVPATDWPAVPGYVIEEELAPGGMGVVYRARQVGLNRTVALKMIRTGVSAGPQERARFEVEAQAVAALSHSHIIQIYHYGDWNGMPYLAMEFAAGGSLAQRLLGKPLGPPEAAELVEILARAVQFVHERGLIHRDLKPANILLQIGVSGSQVAERDGAPSQKSAILDLQSAIPKLADFGLAKRLDQDQGLTRTQAVLGTASYMAPEQAAGDKQALGPAADIYALGAILYEVLTGQPPFRAETYELTIHKVLSEEPVPPSQLQPEVPADLEAICLKCLEKEPGQRFVSALALAEDLRRYRNGEPISIQSSGTFAWHARAARRAGYEILDTLGQGVLGTVYKARHLRLGRTVALEMFAARGRLDPPQLARLRAAAEAVAQLHHPNIVEVYDFGEQNEVLYGAREYVEGGSLADGLPGPPRPAERTAALVETLARAVHHAHERGLVHGGLVPSQVLLGAAGTCKIIGFGLAQVLRDQPGLRRGQPSLSGYMAPEQADERAQAIGPATDVYALGAMLYQLLSGRPPVVADTVGGMLEQVRLGRPEPPRHWRPEVPRDLEAICLKCLHKEPDQRYPNAAALAEDLRRFRTGDVLFIDDLDEPEQQQRWARRAGYEILGALGPGCDGFTYKARQVALERIVILKRLSATDRFVPGAKSRFRREAHLLAGLRHPNFVQLYDQGEQNDLCYFTREFVDGPSLAEKAAVAPLAVHAAAELTEVLARAIHAAHARGAVHGGLNPGNVRLTPAGVPKITGFRSARTPGSDPEEARPESEVRRLACYLAPEQLERRPRAFIPALDVYALGAVLYTLLTGQLLFPGPTLAETLEQVRSHAPAPPHHSRPDIPPELEAICLKCLDKQPARRPVSAEALAEELRLFLDESR
jgi:eukaryotic-like serine/threonine-protein kinase